MQGKLHKRGNFVLVWASFIIVSRQTRKEDIFILGTSLFPVLSIHATSDALIMIFVIAMRHKYILVKQVKILNTDASIKWKFPPGRSTRLAVAASPASLPPASSWPRSPPRACGRGPGSAGRGAAPGPSACTQSPRSTWNATWMRWRGSRIRR